MSIKAISDSEMKFTGRLVPFTPPTAKDLEGDYFTPYTKAVDEWSGRLGQLPVLVHHDLAADMLSAFSGKTIKRDDIPTGPMGTLRLLPPDEHGYMAEAVLKAFEKSHQWYVDLLWEMTQAGKMNWSSGALRQRAQKAADGQILVWPVIEGTISTTPMMPYLTQTTAVEKAFKVLDLDVSALATEEVVTEKAALPQETPGDPIASALLLYASHNLSGKSLSILDRESTALIVTLDDTPYRVPYEEHAGNIIFRSHKTWDQVKRTWVTVPRRLSEAQRLALAQIELLTMENAPHV